MLASDLKVTCEHDFCFLTFYQGSLLFPKIEFFINLIFEVGVFYKHGQCSFL